MTNKEAYEILDRYKKCSDAVCPPVSCDECAYRVHSKQFDEAFQMALEALQEPKQPDHIVGVSKKDDENRIDKLIQKYKSLSERYYVKARQEYQKYINYQDVDYKAASDNAMKNSAELEDIARWLAELKELREKVNCSERPNSSDDLIRRRDAIDAMCSVCGNDCDKSKFVYDAPQWEQVILCPEHYALTVLPSVQPESCGDAVSRNAIIRALNTMDRYVSDELTLCNTDRKFPKNEIFIVDDVYEEIVENLPSAQPDRKPGRWIRVSADRYTRSAEYVYRCSECGNNTIGIPMFCPDCGAKMDVSKVAINNSNCDYGG